MAGSLRCRTGRSRWPRDRRGPRRRTIQTGAASRQVDIVVNNIGIAVFGPAGAASEADLDVIYGVEEANGVLDDAST
jgi:hypothetical protein